MEPKSRLRAIIYAASLASVVGSAHVATAQEDNALCQVTNPKPDVVTSLGWLTRCGNPPSDFRKLYATMLVEPQSDGGNELEFQVAGHACAEDRHVECTFSIVLWDKTTEPAGSYSWYLGPDTPIPQITIYCLCEPGPEADPEEGL